MSNELGKPLCVGVRQACVQLSVGRSKLLQMIDDGALPAFKMGGRGKVFFRTVDLEALVNGSPARPAKS